MVLCQETDYILLDEPLNNLDMKHSVQMMKHLRKVADELGRTVVIVLHDINFAAHYADRICAMKDGQVVEFGTPTEIWSTRTLGRGLRHPVRACPARTADRRLLLRRLRHPCAFLVAESTENAHGHEVPWVGSRACQTSVGDSGVGWWSPHSR